ncbi:hypothetical protein [Mycolicibacterium pulveris]|uniref:hypothetical protein n=1 Tax=Mycolicibacterium pulveris TaxID=36813 RepID=UPI003CF44770
MATRPITAPDQPHEAAKDAAGADHRHQVTVFAADVAALVSASGGWLYDRASAGWTVNVVVDTDDVRPLTILGATPVSADAASVLDHSAAANAFAVSADLLRSDADLRDKVLRLWHSADTEVTVWGQFWPDELGRRIDPLQHRLSVAARAFKAHALAAAGVPHRGVAPTETLFDLGAEAFRPVYPV